MYFVSLVWCPFSGVKNPAPLPLLKNTIENVMGLMVIMGIVLVLMETIMVSTGM